MRGQHATLTRIADRRHGRVTRAELLAAGVGAKRIDGWVSDGRLRVMQRGVYAVGHVAPSVLGDYLAAVLAGGEGAVLSHRPAAHVLRLLPGSTPPPEVTVPTTTHRRRPGIVIHRVRTLPDLDTSRLHGIAITTVPRTLLDLAPQLKAVALTRACHQAWIEHRIPPRAIEACIARNPHKPGAAKLCRALGTDVTLSTLEDGFVALLRAHDLPIPRTNVDHRGDKVDCRWPDRDLTVELLSYRFHASRRAFEDDVARRRRSNHVAFTYGDVFERGRQTVAELACLLPRAGC